jgi:hypothetical protein
VTARCPANAGSAGDVDPVMDVGFSLDRLHGSDHFIAQSMLL